jgi:hypothetical protein
MTVYEIHTVDSDDRKSSMIQMFNRLSLMAKKLKITYRLPCKISDQSPGIEIVFEAEARANYKSHVHTQQQTPFD